MEGQPAQETQVEAGLVPYSVKGKAWSFLCPQLHLVGNPEAGDHPMTSSKKGRQILQLILFLLKKLALPGSGEAVDLVSEVDLGESVYRVYFEAMDSISEAVASRPYSLLSRLLLN
ncbi:hypothetical protein ACOSQ3_028738 [Xanthoceras sorbifolium]